MFLWSRGILKMNFRYFHEIPVFIFLVSQTFFSGSRSHTYRCPQTLPFLLFLGNFHLYILETLFSYHGKLVGNGVFHCLFLFDLLCLLFYLMEFLFSIKARIQYEKVVHLQD